MHQLIDKCDISIEDEAAAGIKCCFQQGSNDAEQGLNTKLAQ
jgi:hypothetical protein